MGNINHNSSMENVSDIVAQYPPTPVISHPETLDLLFVVEKIVKAAKSSSLRKEFYDYIEPYLSILCSRQKVSKTEGVLLSLIINSVVDGGIDLQEIHEFLDCSNMETIRLQSDINSLIAKKLVSVKGPFDRGYEPTREVLNAYRDNQPYFPPSLKAETDEDLMSTVFDTNFIHDQREMKREIYNMTLDQIFEENKSLPIMRHLAVYGITGSWHLAVVLQLCSFLHFDDDRDIGLRQLTHIFPGGPERNHFIHEMRKGRGILFDNKVIQHGMSHDGLVDTDEYRLTDEAVKKLLPDYKCKNNNGGLLANVMEPDEIGRKELFFSEQVKKQVDTLAGLLDEENFCSVQQRLTERGMRKGFCCLFYGAPGTGKTAQAQELARRTGRKLVRVDLSNVRDKYVGESEKNVQKIFDDYKDMLKSEEKAPILLLNEADGLLTKRNTSCNFSVDKMENTMQNILLQNMEDFEGIMVATTNLAINMDDAFERRFLYKVEFERPDATVRASIWHSLMPNLDADTVNDIAKRYDFSGGQIENIARKSVVDSILFGEDPCQLKSRIDDLCRHEHIKKAPKLHSIGFCA